MNDAYIIRNLDQSEMPQIIDRAAAEGWNPGLSDAAAFFEADRNGFFVGELNGLPVSFISAVNYNQQYGFVGLYIVQPAYRGKGYGIQIWNHALNYLGAVVCGLDGVPAQVENYKRSGFEYAFRQMRLATKAIHDPGLGNIHILQPDDLEQIVAYDTRIFGTSRSAFIRSWLNMENAAVVYAANGGVIEGYAVIRKCGEGYKIGPLFADNEKVAEQLFLACHEKASPGAAVYIDMPESNKSTALFAQKYNMQLIFETARMYKNGTPLFPLANVFGVTSFELG